MEPLSSNTSDKKSLLRSIQAVRNNLVTGQGVYHGADSALYTEVNLQSLGTQCYWISHVSNTIKEAKALIHQKDGVWNPCADERYPYREYSSEYGGILQK